MLGWSLSTSSTSFCSSVRREVSNAFSAHFGPLLFRHVELSRQTDVTAQRADLVLLRRSGLGQIQQNRRCVDAVPLAEQSAAGVLKFGIVALGRRGKCRQCLGPADVAQDFQQRTSSSLRATVAGPSRVRPRRPRGPACGCSPPSVPAEATAASSGCFGSDNLRDQHGKASPVRPSHPGRSTRRCGRLDRNDPTP